MLGETESAWRVEVAGGRTHHEGVATRSAGLRRQASLDACHERFANPVLQTVAMVTPLSPPSLTTGEVRH